jgi:hypothetical protein
MKIQTLSNLALTENGLISWKHRNSRPNRVHLRQGDIDGACGIYSFMMALLAPGVLSRKRIEDIWRSQPKMSTAFGKAIHDFGTLVQEGLHDDHLIQLLNGLAKYPELTSAEKICMGKVSAVPLRVSGAMVIEEVVEWIVQNDMPAIIGLDWEGGGGGHWVTAIGFQSIGEDCEHILVLDPSEDTDETTVWNGVLTYSPDKYGKRPYLYWGKSGETRHCSVGGGLLVDTNYPLTTLAAKSE